ncbi:MAG: hypothetical protein R3E79_25220 [Caldilineaceae bacterium]
MWDLPNVYFEFCSSGIQPGKIRRVIDLLGPERIFFGTDQPLFAPGLNTAPIWTPSRMHTKPT